MKNIIYLFVIIMALSGQVVNAAKYKFECEEDILIVYFEQDNILFFVEAINLSENSVSISSGGMSYEIQNIKTKKSVLTHERSAEILQQFKDTTECIRCDGRRNQSSMDDELLQMMITFFQFKVPE